MPLFARRDGTPVAGLSPVRRIMPFIMPSRNGAYVLFEQTIDARPAQRFLEGANASRPPERAISIFHLVLYALGIGFTEFPRLNRFVSGSRLYQRHGVWLAFSAKTRLDHDAPIFTVKMPFDAGEPVESMVDRVQSMVTEGRSGRESATDREVRFFLRLPAPLLRLGVRVMRWLDARNLLPPSLIGSDPLYASVFVANLGSVGLDAAFHHLYEYGSIPIFVTLGCPKRIPMVLSDGSVGSREVFMLRYTYDERIEDGFYAARALERVSALLEDPDQLGRDAAVNSAG
jgi:hypothetical protein